ncbi:hypothetical protein SAMD00019534_015150 [Acytostelium subglobosum LB1]|uniref:hypothetical protein n=1 Tax=Acytostelium subglobosum LB1 TaxID=1410327 RepID=UPI000644F16B|nr:hypothetical protein SAMD00019534_015150 [Acytostelium subglobosum LB1]GAM18340.1 hypothetical protein SAMD00019534_015150 [Acytostelium subglobosum LB1]|eukprot:XP_012757560.1 hypothetical protein SAMD00019534_015150 [Acytostelium subglobosum LB1]
MSMMKMGNNKHLISLLILLLLLMQQTHCVSSQRIYAYNEQAQQQQQQQQQTINNRVVNSHLLSTKDTGNNNNVNNDINDLNLIVSTLDGDIYSFRFKDGMLNWMIENDRPLYTTSQQNQHQQTQQNNNNNNNNRLDGEDEEEYDAPLLIPNIDGSGEFYQYVDGSIQKIPYTLFDIIQSSPLMTKTQTTKPDSSSDSDQQNTLYIGSKFTTVIVLDTDTGKILKTMSRDGQWEEGCPTMMTDFTQPNTLILTRSDYKVVAIDPSSGAERWNLSLGEYTPFPASPSSVLNDDFEFEGSIEVFQLNNRYKIFVKKNEVLMANNYWETILKSPPVSIYAHSVSEGVLQRLDFTRKFTGNQFEMLPHPDRSTDLVPSGWQPTFIFDTYDGQLYITSNEKRNGKDNSNNNQLVIENNNANMITDGSEQNKSTPPVNGGSGTALSLAELIESNQVKVSLLLFAVVFILFKMYTTYKKIMQSKPRSSSSNINASKNKTPKKKKKPQQAQSHKNEQRVDDEEQEQEQEQEHIEGALQQKFQEVQEKVQEKMQEAVQAPAQEQDGPLTMTTTTTTTKTTSTDTTGHLAASPTSPLAMAATGDTSETVVSISVTNRIFLDNGNTRVGKLEMSSNVLGTGSCGTVVFEGYLEGRKVAVKRMLKQFIKFADREVALLLHSDEHMNVVRYHAKEEDNEFIYLALSYCKHSLDAMVSSKQLTDYKSITITPVMLRMISELIAGLSHLHSLNIVHRDVKPQNILVDPNNRIKISDMGLGKKLDGESHSLTFTSDSFGWQPAEYLNGTNKNTKKVDIFSMGCVIFYLVTGQNPFGGKYTREKNVLKGKFDIEPIAHLPDLYDLVHSMIVYDQALRPSIEECKIHPFFWSPHKQMIFLVAASDYLEFEDPNSALIVELDKLSGEVIGSGQSEWWSRLDQILIDNIGRYRKYNGKSLRDLLRVIRNKFNHYRDLPADVQNCLGALPEGFLGYFKQRFPRLIITTYHFIKKHLRNESQFKQIFMTEEATG